MNVAVPAPGVENGVEPGSVSVPVCAPVAKVSVAVAPEAAFKTTLPATLIEPEANANVAWLMGAPFFCACAVRLPEIMSERIVEESVLVRVPLVGKVLPPVTIEAQLSEPAPAIVAAVFRVAEFCRVTATVTLRFTPALTVKVAELALALLKVIELMVASLATVIASPARITTSSVELGGIPAGHGAFGLVESQLPLPAVVKVAPRLANGRSKGRAQTALLRRRR